jgi:hypothetical protein
MVVLAEFGPDVIPHRGIDDAVVNQQDTLSRAAAFLLAQFPAVHFDERAFAGVGACAAPVCPSLRGSAVGLLLARNTELQ